jgi:serine/threonine protein kinase/tetratricopeptide (TPR) repeat protein
VDSFIASGGSGEVYLATDGLLGRQVALKLLSDHIVTDDEFKRRFLREAQALSLLQHPHICQVYDFFEWQGRDVLVMELVEGQSLSAEIGKKHDLSWYLKLFSQLAETLAATHRAGIIHRDLKPDNVMMQRDGTAKILDFGLARKESVSPFFPNRSKDPETAAGERQSQEERRAALFGDQPQLLAEGDTLPLMPDITHRSDKQAFFGTLAYMSPEQCNGESLTQATDIYSLGLIFRELVTGQRAYDGGDSFHLLLQQVGEGAVRPLKQGLVPDRLRVLIEEMNRPNPQERPSAARVAERLNRLQQANRPFGAWVLTVAFFSVMAVLSYRLLVPPSEDTSALFLKDAVQTMMIAQAHNHSGDGALDWVETGFQTTLHNGLLDLPRLDLVTLDGTSSAGFPGLPLPKDEDPDPELLNQLAQRGIDALAWVVLKRQYDLYYLDFWLLRDTGERYQRSTQGGNASEALARMIPRIRRLLRPDAVDLPQSEWYSDSEFANQAFALGMTEWKAKGPEAAEPYLSVGFTHDPNFWLSRLQHARCLLELGRHAEVWAQMQQESFFQTDQSALSALFRHHLMGEYYWHTASWAQCRASFEEAALLARTLEKWHLAISFQQRLGNVLWKMGEKEQAESAWLRGLKEGEDRGFKDELHSFLNNLGVVAKSRKDWDQARTYYQQALNLALSLKNRESEAACTHNLGVLEMGLGKVDAGMAQYERAFAIYQDLGIPDKMARLAQTLASHYAKQGDIEKAERFLDDAITQAQKSNNRYAESMSWYSRGNFAIAQSRWGEGSSAFQKSQALGEAIEDHKGMALARYGRALCLSKEGRFAESRSTVAEALGYFRQQEDWPSLRRALMVDAVAAHFSGKAGQALALAQEAKALAGAGTWSEAMEERLKLLEVAAQGATDIVIPGYESFQVAPQTDVQEEKP